jgi:2-dehydropantoate 2-reductase
MKVLVVGAGAVGSYYGGRLALAAHEVTLIGRKRHMDAVRENGLTIDSTLTGKQKVRVQTAEAPFASKPPDLVLLCVKSYDTEDAARSLRELIAPQTVVLCLQNGIDNHEIAARVLGANRVYPTVIYVGVRIPVAGTVEHVSRGEIILPDMLSALCPIFESAGISARTTDNILGMVWSKLLLNASCNAIGMICAVSFGEMAADPDVCRVISGAVDEVLRIAEAKTIRIPGENYSAQVLKICESLGVGLSSMLQDYRGGKRIEIEALNGVVVRMGRELGVPTPYNATFYAIAKMMQSNRNFGTEVNAEPKWR